MVCIKENETECCTGCCGGRAAEVMVVEYLETTMSKDLLCKFPDNSAFGFDYSQSSIWSPLLSRNFDIDFEVYNASHHKFLKGKSSCLLQRQLSYDDDGNNVDMMIFKKLKEKIKKKIIKIKNQKKQIKNLDLSSFKGGSVSCSYSLTPIKAWGKVLKAAASKQFKKKSTKKKYYCHLHFSN